MRRTDTKAEAELRRALWALGLRFRKNVGALPGRPDIVFGRARVAVFVDGDFWHGRDWPARKARLERGANARYWLAKITANMARDQRKTAQLKAAHWTVVRQWETDVLRDPEAVAKRIAPIVRRAERRIARTARRLEPVVDRPQWLGLIAGTAVRLPISASVWLRCALSRWCGGGAWPPSR